MAKAIKKGQHIFIPFKHNKAVTDTRGNVRLYKNKKQYDRWFPDEKDEVELIHYAPIPPKAEWQCMTDDYNHVWFECSNCGYSPVDYNEPYNFCPACNSPMTDEAIQIIEKWGC